MGMGELLGTCVCPATRLIVGHPCNELQLANHSKQHAYPLHSAASGSNSALQAAGRARTSSKPTRAPTACCASQREYYKTIANLHYVLPTFGGRAGPHTFRMRDGAATVNSRGVALQRDLSEHVVKDEIFLNHYSTRSAAEYAAKVQRGGGVHKTGRHNVLQLAWYDSLATLDCLDAVRYVQRMQGSLPLGADSNGTIQR